jgi:diamine N-acetyltransferase
VVSQWVQPRYGRDVTTTPSADLPAQIMHVQIRPATPDDVPSLAVLGADAFVAAFGAANPAGAVEDYVAEAFSVETLESQLRDPLSQWLVAEVGEELVGMAHLAGGDLPPEVVASAPVQLSRLYTAAGLTSRGVGSMLMDAAIDAATTLGHDVMWLGVWEHNPRAVAFYRRWGFEQVGTVVFRLGDDDQIDLVLRRRLTTEAADRPHSVDSSNSRPAGRTAAQGG